MKITKLEKKKRLYLLELDSDQTCYITEDTIVRFMLTKDKEISPQEFAEIQTFAQFSYGKIWHSITYPLKLALKKKSETI